MNFKNLVFLSVFSFALCEVWEGYTIYTPFSSVWGTSTFLLNTEGEVIHTWNHESGPASMPYLRQDSSIVYPYLVDNPSMIAGGVGGGIQIISWDGSILWDYEISNTNFQHHHDVQPLPNGNILAIAWERKTALEAYDLGREVINNPINQMWSEVIFELEPIGDDDANIVWEWHLWDHLIQDVDTLYPNYGIISEHPELFNINQGNVGSETSSNADWIHLNSIDYNEELDQIVISSKLQDEIFIIDHSTSTAEAASHTGGHCGNGGDFLYRWGNPQNYERGTIADKQLDNQHGINWIDPSYPGGGNLLVFNNGYTQLISAVYEWETPLNNDGCYELFDNEPFGPVETTWMHSENYQSERQSGAFRLGNGNTLITDSNSLRIIEVNNDGEIQWEYNYIGDLNLIPRAQKYSINYLEVDILLGDVNNDGVINILDVVSTVNIVLGFADWVDSADYNGDGIINVLDIVSIVNVILS
ncbi:MAG: aryl-sulfate sulfotransferase [Candidatus Marinimicrobia bacterium]|nr:aryl-sulfate sulfotransferase [Candidatus Neomarinimicrobiota bacterium]